MSDKKLYWKSLCCSLNHSVAPLVTMLLPLSLCCSLNHCVVPLVTALFPQSLCCSISHCVVPSIYCPSTTALTWIHLPLVVAEPNCCICVAANTALYILYCCQLCICTATPSQMLVLLLQLLQLRSIQNTKSFVSLCCNCLLSI